MGDSKPCPSGFQTCKLVHTKNNVIQPHQVELNLITFSYFPFLILWFSLFPFLNLQFSYFPFLRLCKLLCQDWIYMMHQGTNSNMLNNNNVSLSSLISHLSSLQEFTLTRRRSFSLSLFSLGVNTHLKSAISFALACNATICILGWSEVYNLNSFPVYQNQSQTVLILEVQEGSKHMIFNFNNIH